MVIKSLVILGICFALLRPGFAQTIASTQTAAELTREMSNRLHLNEGQYVKLYRLNCTRMSREKEIAQATKNDAAARTAQLDELQSQYELECGRIMSPSQLSLLMQQQDNSQPTEGGNG